MDKKIPTLITGIIITILGIYFYVFSNLLHWTLSWAILMAGILLIAFWEYQNSKNKVKLSSSTSQPVKNDFSKAVN